MVSLQALVVPSDTTASAKKGAASDPAAAASDESQFLLQQGADTTDCAASYAADDWDWQQSQSQANLGFQDAFEASQGLGATPNLSPAITWAAPKPAVQTASVSGLPVRAVRQPQVQEKPSTAKHVPFSNRRLALPTSKPEMKQRPGVTVQQLNPEFLSVRRPLPKQHSALPPQGTALVKASASSQGAGAFSDADLLGSWPPQAASASIKLRSPMPAVHTQAMSVCASRLEPAGLNCSLKHDATAAATDRAVPGPVTNVTRGTGPGVPAHLVSDVHTLETAKLQPQRACAQVAKVIRKRDCTTAAASGETTLPSKSTAAAASGRSPSPAGATAAATSPAAAIFGPHIAGAVCSQSHAKKKLCLRLAPRQPEPAAAASFISAVAAAPNQAGKNPHDQLQSPAQHGLDAAAAAAAAEVNLAQSSSAHQQRRAGEGQLDGTGEGTCDGRVKGPRNDEAACREAGEAVAIAATAVVSPMGNRFAVASPEAATPAGQSDSQYNRPLSPLPSHFCTRPLTPDPFLSGTSPIPFHFAHPSPSGPYSQPILPVLSILISSAPINMERICFRHACMYTASSCLPQQKCTCLKNAGRAKQYLRCTHIAHHEL